MSDDKIVKVPLNNVKKLKTNLGYPDTRNGKILDTRNNLEFLLRLHNIVVKWNMLLRCREIIIPGIQHFVDEKENADLAHIYHISTINQMPNKNLDRHLDSIAWTNVYHPIVECIKNNPWDGVGRLDSFINCIKTNDQEFSHKIIRKWMISAIAACHSEVGFSAQGVLVLQGKQNIGKTRWVKALDPINCGAVKEGLLLDPSNKDSVITASQCWIAELGELDGTFRKADIARIKSYITNSVDVLRFPYNPRNSYLNRRNVFVATVNENNFLVDDTGNRRWWTVEVDSIDLNHGLDMTQIWSEVYQIWKSEQSQTWLSDKEMKELTQINREHEQIDPFEERFLLKFDFREDWQNFNTLKLSSSEILEKLGWSKPSKSELKRMATVIMKHTKTKPKRTNSLRYHIVPALKISSDFNPNF